MSKLSRQARRDYRMKEKQNNNRRFLPGRERRRSSFALAAADSPASSPARTARWWSSSRVSGWDWGHRRWVAGVVHPGPAAGTVVVSDPAGIAGVGPVPLDTAGMNLVVPRWPAQDPRWAHRRAPSLGPLTRTWKTSYHGRRDNSKLVAGRALSQVPTRAKRTSTQPFDALMGRGMMRWHPRWHWRGSAANRSMHAYVHLFRSRQSEHGAYRRHAAGICSLLLFGMQTGRCLLIYIRSDLPDVENQHRTADGPHEITSLRIYVIDSQHRHRARYSSRVKAWDERRDIALTATR